LLIDAPAICLLKAKFKYPILKFHLLKKRDELEDLSATLILAPPDNLDVVRAEDGAGIVEWEDNGEILPQGLVWLSALNFDTLLNENVYFSIG
jgi:hypothetical protein